MKPEKEMTGKEWKDYKQEQGLKNGIYATILYQKKNSRC